MNKESRTGRLDIFRSQLRQLRKKYAHLKQRELEERIHVSAGYISCVETGRKTPSLDIFFAIADALEVSSDTLRGRKSARASLELPWIKDVVEILEDCNDLERDILIDHMKKLKETLRTHDI